MTRINIFYNFSSKLLSIINLRSFKWPKSNSHKTYWQLKSAHIATNKFLIATSLFMRLSANDRWWNILSRGIMFRTFLKRLKKNQEFKFLLKYCLLIMKKISGILWMRNSIRRSLMNKYVRRIADSLCNLVKMTSKMKNADIVGIYFRGSSWISISTSDAVCTMLSASIAKRPSLKI